MATLSQTIRLPPTRNQEDAPLQLKRAATYAADPKAYLISHLGEAAFSTKQDLLCLPPLVDEDRYGSGKQKQHFEAHVAKLLGKEYATFFITGVMAQNAALRTWCDRKGNSRVAWHGSSHLQVIEKHAFQELWGLQRIAVGGDVCVMPTVEDVKAVVGLPDGQRPAVVLIEVPTRELGCVTWSWKDLQSVSMMCRDAGVALHMDGARLWDIEPYYQETAGKSMADIAALFDSVYVSFYKGIGGTTGCMLAVPDKDFLDAVDIWRIRAGGNLYSNLWNVADNERAFNENIGTFARKKEKAAEIISQVTMATKGFKNQTRNPFLSFKPDPPTCPQFQVHFEGVLKDQLTTAIDEVVASKNIRILGGVRSWKNNQRRLRGEIEGGYKQTEEELLAEEDHWFNEFNIDASNVEVPVEKFVEGFAAVCQSLTKQTE